MLNKRGNHKSMGAYMARGERLFHKLSEALERTTGSAPERQPARRPRRPRQRPAGTGSPIWSAAGLSLTKTEQAAVIASSSRYALNLGPMPP